MKNLRRAIAAVGWVLGVLVLLFIDLLTKMLAQLYLKPMAPEGAQFLPGFIELRYLENPAIAFGIGTGNTAFMIFITVFTCLLSVGIAVLPFTVFKESRAACTTLCFIEAGALGNLIDRLSLGYVRDFLDMGEWRIFAWLGSDFNFGVCNVADYFITVGAVALVFILLFIGPSAAFPLKKSWREEAKRREQAKEEKKEEKTHAAH